MLMTGEWRRQRRTWLRRPGKTQCRNPATARFADLLNQAGRLRVEVAQLVRRQDDQDVRHGFRASPELPLRAERVLQAVVEHACNELVLEIARDIVARAQQLEARVGKADALPHDGGHAGLVAASHAHRPVQAVEAQHVGGPGDLTGLHLQPRLTAGDILDEQPDDEAVVLLEARNDRALDVIQLKQLVGHHVGSGPARGTTDRGGRTEPKRKRRDPASGTWKALVVKDAGFADHAGQFDPHPPAGLHYLTAERDLLATDLEISDSRLPCRRREYRAQDMILIAARQRPVIRADRAAIRLLDAEVVGRMREPVDVEADWILESERAALPRNIIHDLADVRVAVPVGIAKTGAINQLVGICDRIVAAVSPDNRGLRCDVDFRAQRIVGLDQVDRVLHVETVPRRVGPARRQKLRLRGQLADDVAVELS